MQYFYILLDFSTPGLLTMYWYFRILIQILFFLRLHILFIVFFIQGTIVHCFKCFYLGILWTCQLFCCQNVSDQNILFSFWQREISDSLFNILNEILIHYGEHFLGESSKTITFLKKSFTLFLNFKVRVSLISSHKKCKLLA